MIQAWLVLVLWFLPTAALAIGPHDQWINDAPSPLSLGATGLFGGGTDIGTGTIISTQLDGTLGSVVILTANHVALTNPASFALGSGAGGNPYSLIFDTGAFTTYTITDPVKNPNNHPVDLSLMVATIQNLNPGSQALTNFNILQNNLPTIVDPSQGAGNPLLGAKSTAPVNFTQLGYGYKGEYDANIMYDGNAHQGYQATAARGERLFQNNQASAYFAPAVRGYVATAYYEPLIGFTVDAPSAAGGGGGMPGDSGGPLYTAGDASAAVINRDGNSLAIPIGYTDSLSAVFVAGTAANDMNGQPVNPFTALVGSPQYAVPIDAGMYDWIQARLDNPMLIPEPSTLALLAVGGLALAGWRLRSRASQGSV